MKRNQNLYTRRAAMRIGSLSALGLSLGSMLRHGIRNRKLHWNIADLTELLKPRFPGLS